MPQLEDASIAILLTPDNYQAKQTPFPIVYSCYTTLIVLVFFFLNFSTPQPAFAKHTLAY